MPNLHVYGNQSPLYGLSDFVSDSLRPFFQMLFSGSHFGRQLSISGRVLPPELLFVLFDRTLPCGSGAVPHPLQIEGTKNSLFGPSSFSFSFTQPHHGRPFAPFKSLQRRETVKH